VVAVVGVELFAQSLPQSFRSASATGDGHLEFFDLSHCLRPGPEIEPPPSRLPVATAVRRSFEAIPKSRRLIHDVNLGARPPSTDSVEHHLTGPNETLYEQWAAARHDAFAEV